MVAASYAGISVQGLGGVHIKQPDSEPRLLYYIWTKEHKLVKDTLLKDHPVTHAGIKPVFHQSLGVSTNARTVIRHLRFQREVSVSRLELAPVVYWRWVPNVPTHPAHLIISVLNVETHK